MKDNVKTVSEVCSAGETGVSAATAGAETLKIRGSESLTTPVRQMGFNMIDLFTGENRFIMEDRTIPNGETLPLSVFHVHNYGQRSGKNYVLSNGAGTEDLHVGKGWKLNVQQYMLPTGKTADGEIAYIYVDALGNEIGFAADKRYLQTGDAVIERTEFKDVEGMGLAYRDLTLRDRQGNRLFFDGDGKLIKIESRFSDGIVISYRDGRISAIDAANGKKAKFSYNAGAELSQIEFSDGTVLEYAYRSGLLTKVTKKNGDAPYARFCYDANLALTDMIDASGYRLNLSYAESKVSAITDYASAKKIDVNGLTHYAAEDGEAQAFSLQDGTAIYTKTGKQMKVRYRGKTALISTQTGMGRFYQFNEKGRCVVRYDGEEMSGNFNAFAPENIGGYSVQSADGVRMIQAYPMAENLIDKTHWSGSGMKTAVSELSSERSVYAALETSSAESGSKYGVQDPSAAYRQGETYVFSAFLKADLTPGTGNPEPSVELCCEVHYSDNSTETYVSRYDPQEKNWQYTAVAVPILKAGVKYVSAFAKVDNYGGKAFFDDIRFCRGAEIRSEILPQLYAADGTGYLFSEITKVTYERGGKTESQTGKITAGDFSYMIKHPTEIAVSGKIVATGVTSGKTTLTAGGQTHRLLACDYLAEGRIKTVQEEGTIESRKNSRGLTEYTKSVDRFGYSFESTAAYDSLKRLTKETDFRGREYTYGYGKYENVKQAALRAVCADGTELKQVTEQTYTAFDFYPDKIYDERYLDDEGIPLFAAAVFDSADSRLKTLTLPDGQTITFSKTDENAEKMTAAVASGETAQNLKVERTYTAGYLTKLCCGEDEDVLTYTFEYDGFGNRTACFLNGSLLKKYLHYREANYLPLPGQYHNYDEITYATGKMRYDELDKRGRLVSRKERDGGTAYQEVLRIEYFPGKDYISKVIDKSAAIQYNEGNSADKWLTSVFSYNIKGELTGVSNTGYRTANDTVVTENGRITSEETEIAPYLSQKTEYRYEERSAGGVYPDHRPVEVQNYYHDGTGYAAYPAYCYDYDELGRVVGEGMADRTEFSVQYQYKKRKKLVNGAVTDDTAETNYIEKMSYRRRGWNLGEETYTYDENGNITEIRDGDNISRFWYDGANRIVKELNQYAEVSYEYDEMGNIISTDAQYVNEDVRIPLAIQRYYYTATGGITGFEHSAIVHPGTGQTVFPICTEYNAGGYPLNYFGKEIIWDGSRMAQMGEIKYKYNAEGIRQEKEVNGRKHIYYTQGTNLLAEKITEEGQPDINKQYLYAGEKPIGFVLNGKPYQYLYNGLGNLVRVFDAKTGRIAAEYSYTAFGSCTVTNHTEENIGNQNPIRYKGYYYDEETRLYYLKSRYYSPDYRIFLSPDEPEYMDPSDFSGLNLYTYCYNNPVNMYDPTGHFPWLILAVVAAAVLFSPAGGTALQVVTSVLSYAGMAVASIFDEDIRNDMNAIGWNPFNTDESATLNSSKVSFYKGVPVFRTGAGGRSGSFGAIFLTQGSGVDTLRHERGHNWQLMLMGIGTYGYSVGIPSPLCLGKWDRNNNYYGAPWETMADILGGVQERTHSKSEIVNAWGYYIVSTLAFPFTALYWF